MAPGQRNIGGERRPLGSTFVFIYLNNEFLAFMEHILNADPGRISTFLEIRAGNFLERKKTVPFAAIFNKSGFETRLKTSNDCFVDVALALFLSGRLYVDVDKLLNINNGDT